MEERKNGFGETFRSGNLGDLLADEIFGKKNGQEITALGQMEKFIGAWIETVEVLAEARGIRLRALSQEEQTKLLHEFLKELYNLSSRETVLSRKPDSESSKGPVLLEINPHTIDLVIRDSSSGEIGTLRMGAERKAMTAYFAALTRAKI